MLYKHQNKQDRVRGLFDLILISYYSKPNEYPNEAEFICN